MSLDVAPDTPRVWALRETVGLVGTKFGYGTGLCDAFMIHVEGKRRLARRAIPAP